MENNLPDKAKEALDKVKSRKKKVIKDDKEKTRYKRVSLLRSKTEEVNKETVTDDIAILAQARQFIMDITEGNIKVEEITYAQKQNILWFLHKYLPYLNSAVALKTKFMSTTISLKIPDNLKLGSFQKQTILNYHEGILEDAEKLIYNLFMYFNLFGTSYILSSDNWEEETLAKLNKEGIEGPLKLIAEKLTAVPGLTLGQLFHWFEQNPKKAGKFFKETIEISENAEFKKLEQTHQVDAEAMTFEQLETMRKMAFPLIDDLEFFSTAKSLNPAKVTEGMKENVDTGALILNVKKSEVLVQEDEYLACLELMDDFHTANIVPEGEEPDEEYMKELDIVDKAINNKVAMLVYKGYAKAWVEAHLYAGSSETGDNNDTIPVTNDGYSPLHVFRIKDESVLEDLSNADTLIESAIDLLNCEVRQRSHINDTKEKLVTVDVSAAADANMPPALLDEITEDIADAIMTGESNVISLPEGITLTDQTDIIRASNDTEKLEMQSKANIALFFSLSTSMMEDSEAQFSNTYLKIDTAQNVFSQEREAISRMIEQKILKPASVKAGMFCKDKQGRVVVAVPEISFTRISIGRHSEDYNAIASLVADKILPKSHLYEYHNTSREEVTAELIEDALSLDNPDILEGIVSKLQELVYEDDTKELLKSLLKGDTMNIMKVLQKPIPMDEADAAGEASEDLVEKKDEVKDGDNEKPISEPKIDSKGTKE